MSVQSEILAQTKTRANKQSNLAERGRWNSTNSGAFLRGPRADKGIGQKEKATAKFLGALIDDIMPLSIDKLKETRKEEVNFGKASWAKANKSQRENWANAIKNGYALESDSPYFRQGVAIAYTESLASKYAQDLSQGYEAWTKKNDPKSGSFDDWINSEDEKFQPQFENIDDDVLNEYFLPAQDQVRDRLRSMHTNRLNENYKRDSYNTKENALFHLLQTRFDSVYEENSTAYSTFGSLIADGEASHEENVRRLTLYQGLLEKKNPTRKDFLEVDPKNGQAMWDNYSKLSSKKNENLQSSNVTPITTWESVSKAYTMTRNSVVDLARQIEVLEYKGKPQPEGKQNLSYIEPRNWTPEQRRSFELLIDDIEALTHERKVILKSKPT